MTNSDQLLLQMTLKSWATQISRAEKYFDSKSDADFAKEIAAGKNTIIYLFGHLVTSNDTMMTLFGFGPEMYPAYREIFSKLPDKSGQKFPTVAEVRQAWKDVHQTLQKNFDKMSVSDWLSKHTAMTDEDLVKDPGRNKLSVLISRTGHVAYHLGQLVLA